MMNNVIPFKNKKEDKIKILIREKLMKVLDLEKLDPIADMGKYQKVQRELTRIGCQLDALGYKPKENNTLMVKDGRITAN